MPPIPWMVDARESMRCLCRTHLRKADGMKHVDAAFQQCVLVVKDEVCLIGGGHFELARIPSRAAGACFIVHVYAHRYCYAEHSGVPFGFPLRCLLRDRGKGDWDDTRLPPKNTHTVIMLPRRIARPLGAFVKEWTCPSCVRQTRIVIPAQGINRLTTSAF